MRRYKNFAGLFSIFGILLITLGCCGKLWEGGLSHKQNCVSADGSKLALTNSYHYITLMDAKTGEVLRTNKKERDYEREKLGGSGAAFCPGKGEIHVVHPKKIVNWENGEEIEHATDSTVIDRFGKDSLLTFRGGTMKTDSDEGLFPSEPLEIFIEEFGADPTNFKKIELGPDKFEGLKKDKRYYWIKPIRLLDNEELLILAGISPTSYSLGMGEDSVEPEPWGFYKLNLQSEKIKRLGDVKKSDVEIHLITEPQITSNENGGLVAFYNYFEGANGFIVFDTANDKELFRDFSNDKMEIKSLLFSQDGRKLAVGSKWPSTRYRVLIYDVETGKNIKKISLDSDFAYLLDFRDDELIIFDQWEKIFKINIETEKRVWDVKY